VRQNRQAEYTFPECSTVAQVSTMVLAPTWAPTLTKDGIKTTPGAI
jgi:hypothetical protein